MHFSLQNYNNMKFSDILRAIIRISIGLLFVFSGYVKVIDPIGSAIKFGDYFEAFGWSALQPGAFAFGIFLAVAELSIGLCFLFSIHMRLAALGGLLFMLFFTPLTFVLAVTDMVKDCGCFGDAVKLNNWDTFFKNLIILPFSIYIFIQRKKFKPFFSLSMEWFIGIGIACIALCISLFTYRHLPFIDFMPYKVGVNILKSKEIPEDAPMDEYQIVFIYEKDGKRHEFVNDLPEYVWEDSTWVYVDRKDKLIKEGYTPPTKDFMIDKDGEYIEEEVLMQAGDLIFITSPDIAEFKSKKNKEINDLYEYSEQNEVNFMMLSSSSPEKNEIFAEKNDFSFPIYYTDKTVVWSMVRSNPGIMLLRDGTILAKWNINDIPTKEEIQKILSKETGKIVKDHENAESRSTLIFILIVAFFFLLFSALNFLKLNR